MSIRNFSRNPCLMRGKRVRYICNIPCQIFEKTLDVSSCQSLGLTAIMVETVHRYDRMNFISGSIFGLRHWWNNNFRHNTDQIKRSTLGFISRLLYHYSNCIAFCSKPRDLKSKNLFTWLRLLYIFQITVSWNENVVICQFFKMHKKLVIKSDKVCLFS